LGFAVKADKAYNSCYDFSAKDVDFKRTGVPP